MTKHYDEDACESFGEALDVHYRPEDGDCTNAFASGWAAGEKPAETAKDLRGVVPIEGRMLLTGTPKEIGEMIGQFLGDERIRCTIEWSADWRGF